MAGPKTNNSDDKPILITASTSKPFEVTSVEGEQNLGIVQGFAESMKVDEAFEQMKQRAKQIGASWVTHFRFEAGERVVIAYGNAWKRL